MKYWAATVALLLATPAFAADLRTEVSSYRAAHEAAIVSQLDELARMRSIAADSAGLAKTATHLEGLLKARGFETASRLLVRRRIAARRLRLSEKSQGQAHGGLLCSL